MPKPSISAADRCRINAQRRLSAEARAMVGHYGVTNAPQAASPGTSRIAALLFRAHVALSSDDRLHEPERQRLLRCRIIPARS